MTAFDLWRTSYQRAALAKRLTPGDRRTRAALIALFHLHRPANDIRPDAA